ncbi:Odorant-binding protein 29, partial [Operophtera brumata]
ALTCRSDGGPKESELKTIYTKCLKMQDGKNSSSSRDSGDQDWKENHRNQRNDREGSQMESDRGRNKDNKMGNRNERRGTDDRMGNHDDRMGNHDYRMGNHDDKMGNYDDRVGNYGDRMGNFGEKMGSHDDRSDSYDRMGSRDSRMGNNRVGNEDNVNGRNDFQHEFESVRYFRSIWIPNNTSFPKTAEDGMPDRYLATHVLTKDVKNEDLKDFLQESIEECFQILDNENTEDKCEFSKNLLMCLSEKGRENCDDWRDDLKF